MEVKKFLPFFIIVAAPATLAFTLPFFSKIQLFKDPPQLLSILAIIVLPFSEGLLLIAGSSTKKNLLLSYRILSPWLAILLFFSIGFLFKLEDCGCWIIGLPLYLILSSLGGLTAGYFRLKKLN